MVARLKFLEVSIHRFFAQYQELIVPAAPAKLKRASWLVIIFGRGRMFTNSWHGSSGGSLKQQLEAGWTKRLAAIIRNFWRLFHC